MTAAERMKEYERLSQNLQQRATVPKYQQDFEKAYGEATNYNADLIGQRSEAIGRAQALPSELRASYAQSAVRNPLEQEALIATRRGNITSDISRLTDLLGARGSRFQDVLGKYTQGYQADLQAEQMALENQWRLYQDALAREEAERARAAAAARAEQERLLAEEQQRLMENLFKQEQNKGWNAGADAAWANQGADITVPDQTFGEKVGSKLGEIERGNNLLSGYDLSSYAMRGEKPGFWDYAGYLAQPRSIPKTLGGYYGNYSGNASRDDMNIFEKILNRKF